MSLPRRLPSEPGVRPPEVDEVVDLRFAPEEIMEVLTIVAVAASAGARPRHALELAARYASGPLASSLRPVVVQIERGADLSVALGRLPSIDRRIVRLRRALEQAEVDGTSYVGAIGDLRDDVRRERLADLEVAAQRLSVAVQFPLVLCVLPAFIVLALVPLVLAVLGDLAI